MITGRLWATALAAIHTAILAAARGKTPPARWVAGVAEHCPPEIRSVVYELSAVPMPAKDEDGLLRYGAEVLGRIAEMNITRRQADLVSELSRLDAAADAEQAQRVSRELMDLEQQRRALMRD